MMNFRINPKTQKSEMSPFNGHYGDLARCPEMAESIYIPSSIPYRHIQLYRQTPI
jgi:hypothetical protein